MQTTIKASTMTTTTTTNNQQKQQPTSRTMTTMDDNDSSCPSRGAFFCVFFYLFSFLWLLTIFLDNYHPFMWQQWHIVKPPNRHQTMVTRGSRCVSVSSLKSMFFFVLFFSFTLLIILYRSTSDTHHHQLCDDTTTYYDDDDDERPLRRIQIAIKTRETRTTRRRLMVTTRGTGSRHPTTNSQETSYNVSWVSSKIFYFSFYFLSH